MAAGNSPKLDSVTPNDYAYTLAFLYPHLRAEVRIITDIFSDAMYGLQEIDNATFLKYNNAVIDVLKNF